MPTRNMSDEQTLSPRTPWPMPTPSARKAKGLESRFEKPDESGSEPEPEPAQVEPGEVVLPPHVAAPLAVRARAVLQYGRMLAKGLAHELEWAAGMTVGRASAPPKTQGSMTPTVAFYSQHCYEPMKDCFFRPIAGPPTDEVTVCELARPKRQWLSRPNGLQIEKETTCINFGSYNYLGFGGSDPHVTPYVTRALEMYGVGCARSWQADAEDAPRPVKLTYGLDDEDYPRLQPALEEAVAAFLQKPAALCMGMGFATNATVLPALLQLGGKTRVLSDALNHRSIVEGVRRCPKHCKPSVKAFRHNDVAHLEKLLQESAGFDRVLIVVEGIYSMEGDFARLREIVALKKKYGAELYLDEAHSIGAIGPTGRGVTELLGVPTKDVDVMMGTFTKSFGSNGGYVAASAEVIAALRAMPSVCAQSAPSPPVFAQALAALRAIQDPSVGPQKIRQLAANTQRFRAGLEQIGMQVLGDAQSPVVPAMLYLPGDMSVFSRACLELGLAVVVVGYPAVPFFGVRARFCLSASHSTEQIEKSLQILQEALARTKIPLHLPKPDAEQQRKYERCLHEAPLDLAGPQHERAGVAPQAALCPVRAGSHDALGLVQDPKLTQVSLASLARFGAGTCGPRGFYGTTLEHVALEQALCDQLGAEDAIAYSHHCITSTSVVQAVAGPDDALFVDDRADAFAQGALLSRARTVVKFAHNDVKDLVAKLAADVEKHPDFEGQRIVMCEGLSQQTGRDAPLEAYAALKSLVPGLVVVCDDSLGFGTLRAQDALAHCDLYVGSFEHCVGSVGGFCAGQRGLVDLQRLYGPGYCFSASAPAFTCAWNTAAVKRLCGPEGAARRERLADAGARLRRALAGRGLSASGDGYAVLVAGLSPAACAERGLSVDAAPGGVLVYAQHDQSDAELLGLADALAGVPR